MNFDYTDTCSKEEKTNFTPQNYFGIVLFYIQ